MVSYTADAQWNKWGKGISGEGPKVTKTLDLEEIDALGVSIGANVYLTQGDQQKVEVKAQQNIIDLLDREVRGGKWRVRLEKGTNLKRHDGIDIYITIPGSGDCEVNVSGSLEVSIAGSGDVKYKGNPDKVKSSIAGSGDVRSF